jgi:hypothetical protein
MKQGLIEKISKNKELPKTMLDVYRSLGYINYKFGYNNSHINDYTNICLINQSLNGLDWNPEINKNLELFYPFFEWDKYSGRFVFYSVFINQEYYNGNFPFGFKTECLAEHAGRTFVDQYNKWLIIPKKESKLIEEVDYRDIKTMSDVYKINGITKLTTIPETKERYYEDLILVAKALNGNWKHNWSSNKESVWYPHFKLSSSFRFSITNFSYRFAYASVGSRLYFKNQNIAEYAGKKFIEQYKKLMSF